MTSNPIKPLYNPYITPIIHRFLTPRNCFWWLPSPRLRVHAATLTGEPRGAVLARAEAQAAAEQMP